MAHLSTRLNFLRLCAPFAPSSFCWGYPWTSSWPQATVTQLLAALRQAQTSGPVGDPDGQRPSSYKITGILWFGPCSILGSLPFLLVCSSLFYKTMQKTHVYSCAHHCATKIIETQKNAGWKQVLAVCIIHCYKKWLSSHFVSVWPLTAIHKDCRWRPALPNIWSRFTSQMYRGIPE